MINNMTPLGKFLLFCRNQRGWTQAELAKMIFREDQKHISISYLSDIERGNRTPDSDHLLIQFAVVFEVNIDYLQYLSGRFPVRERTWILSSEEFEKAMAAFRQAVQGETQI